MVPVYTQLVLPRGLFSLPPVMESLRAQTYAAIQLRMVDNGVRQEVVEQVRAVDPQVTVLRNMRDQGYGVAQNQLLALTASAHRRQGGDAYVLFLDPSVTLAEDCVEQLVATLEAYPDAAAVGPLLLRLYEEHVLEESLQERVASDRIESAGFEEGALGMLVDRLAGERVESERTEPEVVHGLRTSVLLCRYSALQSLSDEGLILSVHGSRAFIDRDLATRFRANGWQLRLAPQATAYHYCGVYRPNRRDEGVIPGYSVTDHWALLLRHSPWGAIVSRLPRLWVWSLGQVVRGRTSWKIGRTWRRCRESLRSRAKDRRQQVGTAAVG